MSRIALILLAIVACKKSPPVDAVEPETPAEATADGAPQTRPDALPPPGSQHAPPDGNTVSAERPPPDLEALQGVARRFAIRDPAPECQQVVDEMASDPLPTLLYVVNTVQNPPWSPMRAAGCVIELYPEQAKGSLVSWVRSEETEGLGRLVLSKLATLPEPVAVDVIKAGRGGPLAEEAVEAAAGSKREAVQAAGK